MRAPALEYEAHQWTDKDGHRHLSLTVYLKVMPYVRQTRTTRWRLGHPSGARARAYNENRGALRDALTGIMLAEHIEPFGPVPLGMGASFGVANAGKCDLGNLEKNLEDCLNGTLIVDDIYIWQRGDGGKYYTNAKEHFSLHLWEV